MSRCAAGWVRAGNGAVALALASCAHAPVAPEILPTPAAPAATNAAPAAVLPREYFLPYNPADYRLAVGDVVEVSVFGHRDTIVDGLPVAPDGRIYYMFGDGVPAAGRTPEEVAREIERRLGRLFNNPRVDILPKSFAGQRFLVLGKVQYPGAFPLESTVTLRQAIANAGGLAQGVYRGTTIEIASLSESYLLRDGRRVPVDFTALINRNDPSQDIFIRPGDVIHIASGLTQSREVYLLGAVNEQKTVAYRDGMTLVELIAGASDRGGGTLDSARLSKIVIVRGALKDPETIEVDLGAILTGRSADVYLRPGDLVVVPEKPYKFARDLARAAVLTFARMFAAEAASEFVLENIFGEEAASGSAVGVGGSSSSSAAATGAEELTNPELDSILRSMR